MPPRLQELLRCLLIASVGSTAVVPHHASTSKHAHETHTVSSASSIAVHERFIAGGLSRMTGQLVLYPIDAMRTIAQSRTAAQVGTMTLLSGVGAGRLVSGCITTSVFALAVGALQFSIIGTLSPTLGTLCAAVCGAVGSCVASVPQEVIKQRLVMGIHPSFSQAVAKIYASEGVRGFYCGWAATASRNVPAVVTTFSTFGALRQLKLRGRGEDAQLSATENMLLGVVSALAGGIITQPIDVIKTRLMTQASSTAPPYAGALDCVRTMWVQEGPGSLYSGLWQRASYMGPLWAVQFAVNGYLTARIVRARRGREGRRNALLAAADGRGDSFNADEV